MRVLSYNIHRGVGATDGKYRPERAIEVIEAQNPDVICIQEIAHKTKQVRHDDQPEMFTQALRFEHVIFQGNRRLKEGVWGNMILSRWPILQSHRISLTWQNRKERGAILAVIDSPEGPLHVINWHLGLSARERMWQTLHLMHHPLYRESAHLPTLLIGDSNDWRNRLWIHVLSACHYQHATRPLSRFRTYPSTFPVGSLDKAYLLGDVDVRSCTVVRDKLTRVASDHLPLIVDMHLNGAAKSDTKDSGGKQRSATGTST